MWRPDKQKTRLAGLLFLAVVLSCLVSLIAAESQAVLVQVGGHVLKVRVARTPAERARGLAGIRRLGQNEGMLFVFPEVTRHAFYMKGVLMPLDIAFIDGKGKILAIHSMDPATPSRIYPAPAGTRYAVETPVGWFDKHGIKPDDYMKFGTWGRFKSTGKKQKS